jgi:serine protease Do
MFYSKSSSLYSRFLSYCFTSFILYPFLFSWSSLSLNAFEKTTYDESPLTQQEKSLADQINSVFRRPVDRVIPTLVNIKVYKDIKTSPFAPDLEERGIGSGCIIDKRGYLITNNHVVAGTSKIEVVLSDGRIFTAIDKFLDPATDLAVVQIDPVGEDLPVAQLGDSDQVKVGDLVLAMGSPFGLEQTVTSGIISYKGRQTFILGRSAYEDFLQTDADINQGNSGGPLVNLYGEVIGINSNIKSPTGVSAGYGFAIPSNIVKFVAAQLIERKEVKRGWLGVWMQGLEELREILSLPYQKEGFRERFKKDPDKLLAGIPESLSGVVVFDIVKDSPAGNAGMLEGDIILEINGKKVASAKELRNMIGILLPGTHAQCRVWRGGEEVMVDVLLGDSEAGENVAKDLYPEELTEPKIEEYVPNYPGPMVPNDPPRLGVSLQQMTPEMAAELGYPAGTEGLMITSVLPGSLADEGGLLAGDIILAVDGQKIATFEQLKEQVANADFDGKGLEIKILNQNGEQIRIVKRGAI